MSITIDLTPDQERKLSERAARTGQDLAAYVHRLIERDIKDVDDALAPFRRQVADSCISDSELASFFESVRDEVWREKHGLPDNGS